MSVPFKIILFILNAERAVKVKLIGYLNISIILNDGTIGMFLADMPDSHSKWPSRSLNHLLLQSLDLYPVFRTLSLVEWRQAALHCLVKEIPRVCGLQACLGKEVV